MRRLIRFVFSCTRFTYWDLMSFAAGAIISGWIGFLVFLFLMFFGRLLAHLEEQS